MTDASVLAQTVSGSSPRRVAALLMAVTLALQSLPES